MGIKGYVTLVMGCIVFERKKLNIESGKIMNAYTLIIWSKKNNCDAYGKTIDAVTMYQGFTIILTL